MPERRRLHPPAACASQASPAHPAPRAGKAQRPPRLLLDLLRALPAAGRHPAALPFVLRSLQPLLGAGACWLVGVVPCLEPAGCICRCTVPRVLPSCSNHLPAPRLPPAGTPEVLQAAGLRLLCRLWHASGGRAYPQLRAAVIGEGQLRWMSACPHQACLLGRKSSLNTDRPHPLAAQATRRRARLPGWRCAWRAPSACATSPPPTPTRRRSWWGWCRCGGWLVARTGRAVRGGCAHTAGSLGGGYLCMTPPPGPALVAPAGVPGRRVAARAGHRPGLRRAAVRGRRARVLRRLARRAPRLAPPARARRRGSRLGASAQVEREVCKLLHDLRLGSHASSCLAADSSACRPPTPCRCACWRAAAWTRRCSPRRRPPWWTRCGWRRGTRTPRCAGAEAARSMPASHAAMPLRAPAGTCMFEC